MFDEIFDRDAYELDSLRSKIGTGLVIDIGANIGTFALRALQLFPNCSLIAVEPNPVDFEHLLWNLNENFGKSRERERLRGRPHL